MVAVVAVVAWWSPSHPSAALQVTVDMELSVSGLEDMGDAITFQLQLWR